MTHAKLSPSSSHRWLKCTASVKACEAYDNFGNEASRWGSACHFLGESMLLNTPLPNIGEHIEGVEVDNEMMRTAEEYVDYVKSIVGKDGELLVEERFDLSHLAPDTFGTSDATVLIDGHLHIIDLKTGHNIVNAEENTQMMMYALGALKHFENEWIEEVTLHIVQTRAGHISDWTTDVERLEEFGEFVSTQAKAIFNDEVKFSPSEKACQWCDHKANCKALAEHVESIVTGEFDDISDIDGKADQVTPDHITRIIENEDLIIGFIKAIKEKALENMKAGEHIEGFKLVRSRKHKRWIDAEAAEKYLVRKLKKTGAFKQTLITPTQALKALGKDSQNHLEKLYEVPEGDIIIAPENDSRPAVQNIADQFDEIS